MKEEYIPHWWELPPLVRERVLERLKESELPKDVPPRSEMIKDLEDLRLYNCLREHKGDFEAAMRHARAHYWPRLSRKEWQAAYNRTLAKIQALAQDQAFLVRAERINQLVTEELERNAAQN